MHGDGEEQQNHAPAEAPQGEADNVSQRSPMPEVTASEAGSVDKIRQILFGPYMQDYEKRFLRLEERIRQEAAELRDEFRRRHEALEVYIKNELAASHDRLAVEHNERADSVRKFLRDLKEISETFDIKTRQLAEQASSSQRELRQLVLEQSNNLSDDIRQKYTDISAMLERQVQEIRTDKTDRSALAALFTEVAMRLNNDWQLPGINMARETPPEEPGQH